MYLDYILFIVGGALLLVALVLGILLIRSRKRSRDYRRVLQSETQKIDVVSTMRSTMTNTSMSTELISDSTELMTESSVIGNAAPTELMTGVPTELSENDESVGTATSIPAGLDISPLEGKYDLIREIHGGGMSRIFLARHAKLGNEWIVKFVDGRHAELANEAEVLKKLNHISLPQIIDIFQTNQGLFLVERFIEGYSLSQVLELDQPIRESLIADWGLQIAQVLNYLHNLETPIIHCDMKPSNIMVTYDNRLVLIDFGISKRQGYDDKSIGITFPYAAPEQFTGKALNTSVVQERFGKLPVEHSSWQIDPRTDLYSTGVILFELATGQLPKANNLGLIYNEVTQNLADVILKCLEVSPDKRYQSAQALADALEKTKSHQVTMARKLTLRRMAGVCCAASLVVGVGSTASAAYINQQENMSIVNMDPGRAVVTAQQSVQILLQKTMPNGEVITLEPTQVQWSYSDDNIARLDGDRLVGLNIGDTTLYGKYRNKVITLDITVTEPVQELVDVALRYPEGTEVSVYAGNGEREHVDGTLADCSFVSPEYLSFDGDTLYISDSGMIRMIENSEVSSLPLEPDFLTADLIRGHDGDIYVLTGPWEADDNTSYYGFLRISDEGAEFIYYTEATWSTISDFAFDSSGTLWFVQQNMGTGKTILNTLNIDQYESSWVMDLPDGASCMAFDETDNLYISVPESGTIIRIGNGDTSWSYFAGIEGERNFIDGAISNFYRPTSLVAQNDAVYVLDFDTVRKITVEGAGALFTETLAGVPTADTNPEVVLGRGDQAVLPASELATISSNEKHGILLSGPKTSILYKIKI